MQKLCEDPVGFNILTPLNSFTLFCAFVGRTEFADGLIKGMGGWIMDTHAYHLNNSKMKATFSIFPLEIAIWFI